MVKIIKKE